MSKAAAVRGTLECFYDIVSPYSYIAFESLLQYERRLPVKLDFRPVFNGIIMKQTENPIPAGNVRKADQMWRDLPMCAEYYGIPYHNVTNFNDRVMKKRATLALRFLIACKENEPEQVFRWANRMLFTRLYVEDKDIFSEDEVKELFNEKQMKNRDRLVELMNADKSRESLTKLTNEALSHGSFGVPWLVLKQDGKETIRLFGSDRLPVLCHLLDVPFEGKLGGIVKLD